MSSKRQALETIIQKLKKLLPHLGNANAGEGENARQAINRLLKTAGLDWLDLVAFLSESNDPLLEMLERLFAKDPDILIKLGLKGATFFHSADASFADVIIKRHRETLPVSGSEFADWLRHLFFREMKKAPSQGAMKQAIETLGAHAKFDGERRDVHLRAAKVGGKIYLDIGDEDWNVVEIDASGWRMIEDSPVRFRRAAGMKSLPLPERGGTIDQLRDLVNLNDQGFVLFVSWILDGLRPGTPHPLLYLAGEQGSAKTTAARIARSFVDPNKVPLRNLPTTVRNLFVSANGSHALAFDNISSITATTSDALCQIASGTGFGERKGYSDIGQILVGGSRPVILNGLMNAITKSDLADRTVLVPMARISSDERRSESEIWTLFENQRSRIFGALLDCVACGLRNPRVKLSRTPRMADFACWSVATEAFPKGVFLRAFESSAYEANEAVAENDAVVVAVSAFMMERPDWCGTVAGLLDELKTRDRSEAVPSRWKTWPTDPGEFGRRLRQAMPVLRKIGIEIVFGKAPDRNRTRTVTLRRTDPSDGADSADTRRATTPAHSSAVIKFKKSP